MLDSSCIKIFPSVKNTIKPLKTTPVRGTRLVALHKNKEMSKQILPTYSINTLKDTPLLPNDFVADYFAHYLDEHTNLHFPHKHSFYHLVYFSKGSGSHSIDFVKFNVEAGQIYFMIPGQVHSWDFATKPDGYIVNFSEQYINALVANPRYLDQFSFFSGIAKEQVITIPKEGTRQLKQILEAIVREGNSKEALKMILQGQPCYNY